MIGPTGGLPPIGNQMQTYFQPHTRPAAPKQNETAEAAVHRDSTSFSPVQGGQNSFQKELSSRISTQVRTATTTGDIRALQQEVAAGTYVIDPAAIAGRMISLAGGRG